MTVQETLVGGRFVTLKERVNTGGSVSLVVEIREKSVLFPIAGFSRNEYSTLITKQIYIPELFNSSLNNRLKYWVDKRISDQ